MGDGNGTVKGVSGMDKISSAVNRICTWELDTSFLTL